MHYHLVAWVNAILAKSIGIGIRLDSVVVAPVGVNFFASRRRRAFFRGYLLRLIYARRASLLWAVYIPSLLFGLAHFDPVTYGGNAVFYVFNTTVTGVILCFIVLWRGNIGMAMGIHFAVNISAILIVGQDNTPIGSGGAFWVSTIAPKSDTLGLIMVAFTLLEIILYFVWAKRYHGALIPRDVGSV